MFKTPLSARTAIWAFAGDRVMVSGDLTGNPIT